LKTCFYSAPWDYLYELLDLSFLIIILCVLIFLDKASQEKEEASKDEKSKELEKKDDKKEKPSETTEKSSKSEGKSR
jgi:hypothetical protein